MSIFDIFDKISAENKAKGGIEYIIAGLGNPGMEYDGTRHNAGFFTVDMLAEQYGVELNRMNFKGKIAEVNISDKHCLLLKRCQEHNRTHRARRFPTYQNGRR